MKVLITGATGFVGRRLVSRFEEPSVLSRNGMRASNSLAPHKVHASTWQSRDETAPLDAFKNVEAVFHLAGESVAEGRWTPEKKRRILESRVFGTRNLVDAIERLDVKPKVLVSVSAIGYYGSQGDQLLEENATPVADDFLSDVCVQWEKEAQRAEEFGVRVVNPRVGIVLGAGGGALGKMLLPFKLGMGSPLGNGKQYMSWIHIDDLVGLLVFAAQNEHMRGPVNAVSPNPVTNYDFTKTLGKVVNRPTFMPAVPGFMLKLVMGDFAGELLGSQRVSSKAAEEAGYNFQYQQLEAALQACV